MKFLAALDELQAPLKRVALVCIFSLIFGFIISKDIIRLILSFIPSGIKVIPFSPMETFNVAMETSVSIMLLFTIPILVFELTPALYRKEKDMLGRIVIPSIILFILGVSLSFYLLVIKGLEWFIQFTNEYGFNEVIWSLQHVIGTVITVSMLSGLCFLFPIPLYYAVKHRIIWPPSWKEKAVIFAVLIIITGVIIPDATLFSQIGLSIPIYLLMEGAIYLAKKRWKHE